MNINNNEIIEENYDEFYDYLPADHPLMKNLQDSLEKQLKEEEEQLRLVQKEKNEELKKAKRKREDIGVNLYNFQQRYAKLEETFNEEYNRYMVLKSQLEETDKKLNDLIINNKNKNSSIKEQNRMVLQATEELNQLNSMLKYVEQYNIEVKSQIEVTNRNAQVVEKKMLTNEVDKKKQDFLIDNLEDQIKSLHEKKLLFESQLKNQEVQTKEARENLVEAQDEIKNIIEKKKNILENWNKAIINMKAKDKAMQKVFQEIKQTESDKVKYNSQISKYKELIYKEVEKYEELEHKIKVINYNTIHTQKLIDEIKENKYKQDQKHLFIVQSIRNSAQDIKLQENNEANYKTQLDLIEKNKLRLHDMARTINEKNLNILSNKETHEKQTENIEKTNLKLEKDIANIELEKELKLNEISRVEIDALNVETQNESIEKKIKLMNKEIEKSENKFKECQSMIKKNHEDLEKKQLQVDRLNKQFGYLTKNKGSEDEGFYEVKIKELQLDIANIDNNINNTEDNWIKNKSVLVDKVNINNTIKDNVTEMKSKSLILSHKKIRLQSSLQLHEKEIRDIEISLKNLRYDMNKYNVMLSKNVNSKEKLNLKFFDVEIEFKEKLKQMENLSTKYDLEIESLREEKADILSHILEVERQIHLWERKIKLENKMTDIIKPESGKKEIDDITYTIHRQEILYRKLLQEEKQVIKNMKMEVDRRDYIKLKFPNKTTSIINSKVNKNNSREINKLKEDINYIAKEKIKIVKILEEKKIDWQNFQKNFNENIKYFKDLENTLKELENKKLKYIVKKNNISYEVVKYQIRSKILEENTSKVKIKKKEFLYKEYQDLKNSNDKIIEIIFNNAKNIFDEDLVAILSQSLSL